MSDFVYGNWGKPLPYWRIFIIVNNKIFSFNINVDRDIANAEEVGNWRLKQALEGLRVLQGEGEQKKDEGYLWLTFR